MSRSNLHPQLTLGIRAWVLVATILAVLPLLAFSSWIVFTLVQKQHADDNRELLQRSQSLALAVERRMDRAAIALGDLAVSQAALQQNFAELYDQAQRAMALHHDAVAIGLMHRDGSTVFTTVAPFGVKVPPSPAARYVGALFDHGATVYSPLYTGAITKRRVMVVSVPLRIDGRIEYSLQMVLPTEALTAVLNDQVLPPEWTAGVFDPQRIVAGGTGTAAKLVGKPASESLKHAITAHTDCPFNTTTPAGVDLSSCAVRVPDSDWYVAIGVPTHAFETGLRDSLLKLLLAGALSIVLGIVGAFRIANLIRRDVTRLANAAMPGADAQARDATGGSATDSAHDTLATSSIREIASVREGLRDARRREDELASQLTVAKHDSLTGLAGRELFRERVEKDRLSLRDDGECIALLFIDLDGFKAVNDRLGHDAGDDLLRDVALAIRGVIRASDIASRLGGDEFVVYIRGPKDDLASACAHVAQRLILRVGLLCDGLGCSIGVAIGARRDLPLSDLLNAADRLMLQAKAQGKARCVIETVA